MWNADQESENQLTCIHTGVKQTHEVYKINDKLKKSFGERNSYDSSPITL